MCVCTGGVFFVVVGCCFFGVGMAMHKEQKVSSGLSLLWVGVYTVLRCGEVYVVDNYAGRTHAFRTLDAPRATLALHPSH